MKRILLFGVCLAAINILPAADRAAVIKEPVKVPIVINGKSSGETTLPIGTKVKVVKEEAGRIFISAPLGSTWVAVESVDYAPHPAESSAGTTEPETTNPPQIASTPTPITQPTPNPAERSAQPAGVAKKPQRVIAILMTGLDQHTRLIIDCMKSDGHDVKMATNNASKIAEYRCIESFTTNNQPWLSRTQTGNPPIDPDMSLGRRVKSDNGLQYFPLTDELLANFDVFYFTSPIEGAFSPEDTSKLLNSGKALIVNEMTPAMVRQYAATGKCKPSYEDKKPGRVEVSGDVISYYIYGYQKKPGRKYHLTDDKSAEEFIKGKLYPAIKNAGL